MMHTAVLTGHWRCRKPWWRRASTIQVYERLVTGRYHWRTASQDEEFIISCWRMNPLPGEWGFVRTMEGKPARPWTRSTAYDDKDES